MMRPLTLILAVGVALPASAALAQTAYGPTGDKLDDGTCYAQALAAQHAADNRATGEIALKRGLTYDEQVYLRACGGSAVAVPAGPPPQAGYYYYDESSYAPVRRHHRHRLQYTGYYISSDEVVTNGPVRDTPANRALYPPLSHAGRATPPDGN